MAIYTYFKCSIHGEIDSHICKKCEAKDVEKLEHINFTNLYQDLDDYVKGTDCDHYDCDCEHFLYEQLLKTVYGKDIFHYLNKKFFK